MPTSYPCMQALYSALPNSLEKINVFSPASREAPSTEPEYEVGVMSAWFSKKTPQKISFHSNYIQIIDIN